ncbi:MAG: hypothetical protein WAQ53_07840 [Thiofilum sp.]|uniref:hypothetical protein n=1 Tax=Thiofilum sp. TaxID=2212733 RepID=UPI0025ED8E72|nr:hypothetical protein [Thiofilum sp.]MBK8454094.1 hypothetical protein [Thiofilum sp.]
MKNSKKAKVSSPKQSPLVTIVVNDQAVMQYDRRKQPSSEQFAYIDNMDKQMDQGIEIAGTFHKKPDPVVKSQLVAQHLLIALADKNYSLAAAMCTWLSERMPELIKVQASGTVESMRVDLVFARPA